MQLLFSGLISGLISGLGMGGGVILVAILTYVTQYNQLGLQTINLLYYIPTAIFAIVVYLKNKEIDYKLAIKIILWGIVPTIVSAFAANVIDTSFLRKTKKS
jgi:uncharacterized membrane protein YfcA